MSLDLLYQDVILDHWRNPRHAGELSAPQATVHRVNPTCGDEVTVDVELGGEAGDVLIGFAHRGHGCSISRGAASVFAELAVDHTVVEIAAVHEAFVEQLRSAGAAGDIEVLGDAVAFAGVGRFPARVRCALLPWTAAAEAIEQARAARQHPTALQNASAQQNPSALQDPSGPEAPTALTGDA